MRMHIPMRDDFVQAHAHATAQRAFDIPAALRTFIYHYRTVESTSIYLPVFTKLRSRLIHE